MKPLLRRTFGLREGEGRRAVLLFAYIFLLIAALLIIKPVRNSLFLIEFGVQQLPFAFFIVAIVSVLAATIYTHFTAHLSLNRVMQGSLVVSIVSLGLFWSLLERGWISGWLTYTFYIWVALFGLIMATQFWLLANQVFNSREAKRTFGLLGAGAISGGIAGGYLTNYLAPLIGTNRLLLLCIAFLLICTLILPVVWTKSTHREFETRRTRQLRTASKGASDNALKLILESKHLTYLTAIVLVGVIVATFVDYLFSAVAVRMITDQDQAMSNFLNFIGAGDISNEDKLTAFFGFWLSTLSIISLIVQIFFTRRILTLFGVTASLFILPAGILIGIVAMLVQPGLFSAIVMRLSEGSLKQSINKAGMELLILPVPVAIKMRSKAFIDVFVNSAGSGIGGLILIAATIGLGFEYRQIGLITIGMLTIWFVLVILEKKEYLGAFKSAIEKRTIDLEASSVSVNDASLRDSFIRVLDGKNERQILYVLKLLENAQIDTYVPYLERLMLHNSVEIRKRILYLAINSLDINIKPQAERLTEDDNEGLRVCAMEYLFKVSDTPLDTIQSYINHTSTDVKTSAMLLIAEEYSRNAALRESIDPASLFREVFQNNLIDNESAFDPVALKMNAARVIGALNLEILYPELMELLKDESIEVRRFAALAAGKTHSPVFIATLTALLGDRFIKRDARQALAEYGIDVIDHLAALIDRGEEDLHIRVNAAQVLAQIGTQKSVTSLLVALAGKPIILRYQLLKSLNRLRFQANHLRFPTGQVEAVIMDEAQLLLNLISAQLEHEKPSRTDKDSERTAVHSLLSRALQERIDDNLERIFRLLGLRYPPSEIYSAYSRVIDTDVRLKADAVEYLDNLLSSRLRRIIIPLVDSVSKETLLVTLTEVLQLTPQPEVSYLTTLLESDDHWLQACTLYYLAEAKARETRKQVDILADSQVSMVRETARMAQRSLDSQIA